MNAPQRYVAQGGSPLVPMLSGDLVLFAHIEPALRDAERFAWVLPIISGKGDDSMVRPRMEALAIGLLLGLKGRDLVDFARERCAA